ncbi:MAG TPA: hypothetical protein VM238_18185 [Phycisphaerae bacterium]|nr:hypothetical protein [Phycisphaerae bacterium]
MFYVRCGTAALGTPFYTFPANCRIKSREISRRTSEVEIPSANGVKDIGDGKVSKGGLQIVGRIWAASAEIAEDLCAAMETALVGRDNSNAGFYVWTDRGSGTPPAYPVTGCSSMSTTIVDATGGLWIDIAVTFTRNGLSV